VCNLNIRQKLLDEMDFICSYFLFGQMRLLFEYKHLTKNPAYAGFYWMGEWYETSKFFKDLKEVAEWDL
jgi:hypothetical protein